MGSSPALVDGQIPTAKQWNDWFAAKADDPLTNPTYAYYQPTTGGTVTVSAGVVAAVLDPAGELATLTVNAPVAALDGQIFELSSTQTIDALTVQASGGQTLLGGAVAVLGGGGGMGWRFRATSTTWYRRY